VTIASQGHHSTKKNKNGAEREIIRWDEERKVHHYLFVVRVLFAFDGDGRMTSVGRTYGTFSESIGNHAMGSWGGWEGGKYIYSCRCRQE
jgi:hypothetical protein